MLEQSRLSRSVADTAAAVQTKHAVESVPSAQASSPAVPNLGELPDLLLVERTRGRDARAFEALMRRYNRRLYRITRSILRNDDLAVEAVRAAYYRAFADLDRYEPAGKFACWLTRLAFEEALALRRFPASTTPASTATACVEGTDAAVIRQHLEGAIDMLPEVFRTVLVLRVLEDLSGVEVAAGLGLNETTVRTRLYRAQQRLQPERVQLLRIERDGVFALSEERSERIVAQVFGRIQNGAAPPVPDAR